MLEQALVGAGSCNQVWVDMEQSLMPTKTRLLLTWSSSETSNAIARSQIACHNLKHIYLAGSRCKLMPPQTSLEEFYHIVAESSRIAVLLYYCLHIDIVYWRTSLPPKQGDVSRARNS
jgi:hypothetical protein